MSDLPAGVYAVKDRHGKTRYRFRRKNWASTYLPSTPGTAEFHRAYAEIIERGPLAKGSISSPVKVAARSLDDLFAKHRATMKWQKKGARTRLVQGRIIGRFLDRQDAKKRRYGERPVDAVTVTWLERILAGMSETPAAANVLRKVLSGLMDTAVKLGWRSDNPARMTDTFQEGTGFRMWTEGDIAQFRAAHALGSMARLTLELALNTAARRCDMAKLKREDIVDGQIKVAHAKGNNEATIPLMPTTKAAIDAMPVTPIKYLVVTQVGNPFTVAGLGNRMRAWCDTAGLPDCTMHGLRKAVARRIAESGGTDAEGQAITGHKKAETFAYYRAKANRTKLASRAMSNLASEFDSQPQENGGKTDD